MQTLSDLLAYCRSQARIEACDYLDPCSRGNLRTQQLSAWRRDCRLRDKARKQCLQAFSGRLLNGSELLVPGSYGPQRRLTISLDGVPDYCPGIYSPREIYGALFDYLTATN